MISKEKIKKISELARVGISDEEIEKIQKEIEDVLVYVNKIQSLDLKGVEDKVPSIPSNVLRKDENPHSSGEYSEDILSLAPHRKENWIKVKKVLGE